MRICSGQNDGGNDQLDGGFHGSAPPTQIVVTVDTQRVRLHVVEADLSHVVLAGIGSHWTDQRRLESVQDGGDTMKTLWQCGGGGGGGGGGWWTVHGLRQ